MRGESGRVAARVRELLGDAEPQDASEVRPGSSMRSAAEPGPQGTPVPERPAASPLRRWAARVPVRLDPGRRAALAVGAAVLVAAIVTGGWLLAERPRAMAVSSSSAAPISGARTLTPSRPAIAGTTAAGSPPAPSASPQIVVVDVAGKVHRPGVYRLPAGSRVNDAVRAAGGPLAKVSLNSLNLAAKLVDGQQVAVGVTPAAGAPPVADGEPGGAGGGSSGSAGPVDLNTATLDQLETLPGVGPVLGQHILDWRGQHGRFTSVDQLDDVPGIGPTKFAALKPLVTV